MPKEEPPAWQLPDSPTVAITLRRKYVAQTMGDNIQTLSNSTSG